MPKNLNATSKPIHHSGRWWFSGWDRLVNQALKVCGKPIIEVSAGYFAVDFHIHTIYSHCSVSRPENVLLKAASLGLAAIAIMDHHHVEGALETIRCAQKLKTQGLLPQDFLVIPGVELNSTVGHIGALFVTEDLPEKLSPADTVRAIHDAGGLAVAVHPCHSTGVGDAVFDVPFDAVEIECGSVFDSRLAQLNRSLANDPRLSHAAKIGGSDAHYLGAIGGCYAAVGAETLATEEIRDAIIRRKCNAHSTLVTERLQRILGIIRKLR